MQRSTRLGRSGIDAFLWRNPISKYLGKGFLAALGCIFLNWNLAGAVESSLRIEILPRYKSASLALESALTNSTGEKFSVSRLDFLLSDFALRSRDGTWRRVTNSYAFVSVAEKRTGFDLPGIPSGEYETVRFCVGVAPEINHGNPAKFAAGHPLNPNLNHLHWSWANGYIFFAAEGHWHTKTGKLSGYSFHLGNDPMLMTVEIPLHLQLSNDTSLQLALEMGKFFDLELSEAKSSTHSRIGDELAVQLRENVKRAFSFVGAKSNAREVFTEEKTTNSVEHVGKLTPYRLTFSDKFPLPDLPRDNPLTEEGVELGRRLFFEKKLSINDAQSCASCHEPEKVFTDSPRRFSTGAERKKGTRNSMPLFNLAWKKNFFWDGRASSLRAQVLMPIQDSTEMHQSLTNLVEKLKNGHSHEVNSVQTNYSAEFKRVFGTPEITAERIAKALEQFLFTQLSFDSKFDRAMAGELELNDEEKRGFELFITEFDPRREQFGADCFHCHGGPLTQSQSFANNGLDAIFTDFGRYIATTNESDKGKFAVPSLRNVELTAPYMHDGRFKTLEEVIEHYSTGVKRSATLDPNIAKHPDGGVPLSSADKKALVAFLKSLTDEKYKSGAGLKTPSTAKK